MEILLNKKILITLFAVCGFFSSVAFADAAGTILTPPGNRLGLVGHWTFDGPDMVPSIRDKSGNNNHGRFVNVTATSTNVIQGPLGQAAHFRGLDDHMNMGTNSSLQLTTKASYSFWIRPESIGLLRIMGVFTVGGLTPHQNNGYQVCMVLFGGTNSCSASNLLVPNAWTHVAIVFDSDTDTVDFYKNGVFFGQVAKTDEGSVTATAFTLSQAGSNDFKGDLDDVRVYNRVLSASEVKNLYNTGGGKVGGSGTLGAGNLAKGLMGHWTFDGKDMTPNVRDVSGNGNHGALIGQTSTTTLMGKLGQALEFDASDDYVDMTDKDTLDFGTGEFTLSAWIINDNDNIVRNIVTKYSTSGYTFQQQNSVGRVILTIDDGPDAVTLTHNGTGFINRGAWTHVAVVATRSGETTTATYYYDGIQQGSTPSTAIVENIDTAGSFTIGNNPVNNKWDGKLDDVRAYNRALSAAEIKQLYNLGSAKVASSKTLTQGTGLANGLVGHWTFDGKDLYQNVADSSGNGNIAKLMNFTATTTAPGKLGQALRVTNTGAEHVRTLAISAFDLNTNNQISVSMWVKPSSDAPNQWFVMHTNGCTNQTEGEPQYVLNINGNRRFAFMTGNGTAGAANKDSASSTAAITPNQWYLLTGVVDTNNVYLYVNGSLVSTTGEWVRAGCQSRKSTEPSRMAARTDATPDVLASQSQLGSWSWIRDHPSRRVADGVGLEE